jgi:hypothetical protein
MRTLSRAALAITLWLAGGCSYAYSIVEPPQLSIRFTPEGIEFAGMVNSEETAQLIANFVKSVRPDLAVIEGGLAVSPEAPIPKLEDLKSLLEELGLSTHEGMITFWKDRILISGLTDSVISIAALKILIEPLMENRKLINRICIVNTDDLPDIKVDLTTLESQAALIDFESYPTAEETFTIPGLPLNKIYPALVMLSDLSRISRGGGTDIAPVRAQPLNGAQPELSIANHETTTRTVIQALPADRILHYVNLQSILFSRSTTLLRADQTKVFDDVATILQKPPFTGNPITISAMRCQGDAATFNEYLCEKRAARVKELLTERGIDGDLFSIRINDSPSLFDRGEVRLQVIIPEAIEVGNEELEKSQKKKNLPE